MGGEDNVLGRLIRKVLYVGAFAFILNSFSTLADIIFRSFAQAGLTAGGGAMTAADLLKPGRLAGTGFSAAWPLLDQVRQLTTRSEEHTSELQALMRISYAVSGLKRKTQKIYGLVKTLGKAK